MPLRIIKLLTLYTIVVSFGQTVKKSEAYFYFIDTHLQVDSIQCDSIEPIQMFTGDFACTKCVETLAASMIEANQDSFAIIYRSLSESYTTKDFLKKYYTAKTELSAKLRAFDVSYTIYFDRIPEKSIPMPYLEIHCVQDSLVSYSYEDLFENDVAIEYCK